MFSGLQQNAIGIQIRSNLDILQRIPIAEYVNLFSYCMGKFWK